MTVAVLPEPTPNEAQLDMRDVRIDVYKGTGKGGQHRNKTETCIRATHLPTGLVARSEGERSKHQNQELALAALAAKLKDARQRELREERERSRRKQVGTGQRGDKVRTVRMQDGVVTCERTGRKHRARDYLRGDLEWIG